MSVVELFLFKVSWFTDTCSRCKSDCSQVTFRHFCGKDHRPHFQIRPILLFRLDLVKTRASLAKMSPFQVCAFAKGEKLKMRHDHPAKKNIFTGLWFFCCSTFCPVEPFAQLRSTERNVAG